MSNSPNTTTVRVPILGGVDASYRLSRPYNPAKPTLILVNSWTTNSNLYAAQFANKELTDVINLLAIELLGHGETRTLRAGHDHWTYWDSALMNIQVMDALDIEKAFVLGTSQGGWITVRMAVIAPERVRGIIPLGTSMDYESARTRTLGCWDGITTVGSNVAEWTSAKLTPDFEPSDAYCNFLIDIGFNSCSQAVRDYWTSEIKRCYRGNDGRRRARMSAICLRDRDGLHARCWDVECPVMWMHGTEDAVYTLANAQEEIKLFVNSPSAELIAVEGGAHFLSATNPKEVDKALIQFVRRWNKK